MSCGSRLQELLEREKVSFQRIQHPATREPEEAARASHVRARHLARASIARAEPGRYVLLVLPASEHLDLEIARRVTGWPRLVPATAAEIARLIPDCEPGATPPFGTLFGMPTVIDLCFFEDEEHADDTFYCEAGNHRELIAMPFSEYRRVAGPFAHEACLNAHPALARPLRHGGRGAL
jgi:Ala-tRNA(Pro) deacylase